MVLNIYWRYFETVTILNNCHYMGNLRISHRSRSEIFIFLAVDEILYIFCHRVISDDLEVKFFGMWVTLYDLKFQISGRQFEILGRNKFCNEHL